MVLGSNPAAATSLRNFGNSVYPALSVCFGGDTKICWSLLCCALEKNNSKINLVYNTKKYECSQYRKKKKKSRCENYTNLIAFDGVGHASLTNKLLQLAYAELTGSMTTV